MMGNSFILVNEYNREYISFHGLGKESEIIGNKITSQMVAYFTFENNGRSIVYVGDQWNVGGIFTKIEDVLEYGKDVTLDILKEMLEEKYITEKDLDSFYPKWRISSLTEASK